MTAKPAVRHVPDEVSVVEVYGSKFLLGWLDREVLASAAAHRQAAPPSVAPAPGRTAAPAVGPGPALC